MLLETTTGREFELDNDSPAFHQSRFLISQLLENGAYDNIVTDEEKIDKLDFLTLIGKLTMEELSGVRY
jgi:hypothetical protein